MTTRPQALARAELATWAYNQPGDTLVVLDGETLETPYAWVVYWTSQRWLTTRRLEYALAGGGPLIIAKATGHLTQFSSAYGTEAALEKYEEENQLYALHLTTDLADSLTRLLAKRLLHLTPQSLLTLARAPAAWVARGSRARLLAVQAEWAARGLATELERCFALG